MQPIEIGAREIYDTVIGLDKKFDTFVAEQDKRTTLLEHRVSDIEEDLKDRSAQRLKVNLALLGCSVSIVGAFIAPLLIR